MYNATLMNSIKDKMLLAHETIAVAESVTSGQLQAALSMAENASLFFQGGITAYNLGQKCRHLNIDPVEAQECDCVSERVAVTMALEACRLFISNWGIGITGYATPIPEQSVNELFAFYAIAYNGIIVLTKRITAKEKDAAAVQLFYAHCALKDLEQLIETSVA